MIWDQDEVKETILMWGKGIPIELMASNFGRPVDEMFVLLLDLSRKGRIEDRQGGIFGRGERGG